MIRNASSLRTAPLGLAACLLLGQGLAHADGADDEPGAGTGTRWGAGLFVMSEVKPYRGVADKTEALPVVTFENRWVRLFGPGLELKLGQAGPVAFGITLGYARDGYKASDAAYLAGMDKRPSSVWVGGRAGLRTALGNLSAEWSGDASGHSKGQRLKLGVERRFALGAVGLTPRLSATWHDSHYTQYYFGVTAAEARADRPAYQPGTAVNTEIGLRLDYQVAPQHMVFADVGSKFLGSAIKNSPLVDRSSIPELRLGYLHGF